MRPAIERGIPVSKVSKQRGFKHRYPWTQMKIGDSFQVTFTKFPVTESEKKKMRDLIYTEGYEYFKKKDPSIKVVTRTVGHGLRFWKMKKAA